MSLDPRILNRVAGYWPGYRMTPQAIKAWERSLAGLDTEMILASLDDFSDEDAKTPPRAGEIRKRVIGDTQKSSTETELERVRRQRREATQLVKDGVMTQRDFDWYEADYWNRIDPIDTPNRKVQAA